MLQLFRSPSRGKLTYDEHEIVIYTQYENSFDDKYGSGRYDEKHAEFGGEGWNTSEFVFYLSYERCPRGFKLLDHELLQYNPAEAPVDL
jgi:hypothetical protein